MAGVLNRLGTKGVDMVNIRECVSADKVSTAAYALVIEDTEEDILRGASGHGTGEQSSTRLVEFFFSFGVYCVPLPR